MSLVVLLGCEEADAVVQASDCVAPADDGAHSSIWQVHKSSVPDPNLSTAVVLDQFHDRNFAAYAVALPIHRLCLGLLAHMTDITATHALEYRLPIQPCLLRLLEDPLISFLQPERWFIASLRVVHLASCCSARHASYVNIPAVKDADKGKQLALQEEYITLLSHQLHSQQEYYDEQIRRLHAAAADVHRNGQADAKRLRQMQISQEMQLKNLRQRQEELRAQHDLLRARLAQTIGQLVTKRKV
ncbi:uncharacterized protein MONBRDRAFT_22113 [Monosiga brevicollis MX1]|uniref:Uncharacterized protein n=1 Tax=Monosiga brevicollis TaxID=81824 RepID=A9UPL5_MONBE|nr:uncharacterized protein MONBRDRAFT_22113 [Monosiga brevicollis MX1]EDQ92444.1 predicted protein [Monosiga brevicollis MX1]|eukprot:XP_001742206.1 hypothetical protein [Monosiga brevicollis MX1]